MVLLGFAVMSPSHAWWHEDWTYRKEVSLDTSPAGADIPGPLAEAVVLVRLHAGNFGYFLDVQPNGEDLRFIDGDDQTPLKFHIERFDPVNQMALVWVKVPAVPGGNTPRPVWMYYGNAQAVAAQDAAGTWDTPQALALHFADPLAPGRDSTAYANDAQLTGVAVVEGPLGAAAGLGGSSGVSLQPGHGMTVTLESGFTLSAWMKIDPGQEATSLLVWNGAAGRLDVRIAGGVPRLRYADGAGKVGEALASAPLAAEGWHHVTVTGSTQGLALYVDGEAVCALPGPFVVPDGAIGIGVATADASGLSGMVDEVGFAAVARDPQWIRFAARAQMTDSKLVVYGKDGQQDGDGGESYFATILHNVTLDGWVVIVILMVMAGISWVVMFSKGLVLSRIRRDNHVFLMNFGKLGASQVGGLDQDEMADDFGESPLLTALSGDHGHYQSSNIYRIYHAGVQEMHRRMPKTAGAQGAVLELSPQAVNAIKATMDGALTRELQKLNSQMVLLTIAISGGPFLGLFGTVVGVMITFAAIAATGDVNVNAIAPGIAAALVATVAGLAVAIPALFGYNYLGSHIKETMADMHVFVDEFVAKIAEQHG